MNNIRNLLEDVVVHEEFSDIHQDVSEQDIKAYSRRLGIDLVKTPGLATLVRDWILQPLPRYWFPCLDTRTGHWFYSNALNGQSTWEHPLEDIHRSLAKEYCNPQLPNSFERENPEGESAEQSMELGLGGKDPISGESSSIGSAGSRNILPRILAPLKRSTKTDVTTITSKPILSPIVSHEPTNETRNAEPDSCSDGGPSAPKSSNPIRSLLPNDILFENRSRPSSSVNSRPIPPISVTGISRETAMIPGNDSISDAKRPATVEKEKLQFLRAYERNDAAPQSAPIKEAGNSLQAESSARSNSAKPSAGLSFTERLAAKKASRSKLNTETDKSAAKSKLSVADSVSSLDKKRVQFDLEKEQVMHYTPENSENSEHKVSDKSESSSSDDLLNLVGDPGDLKPFSDTANFISTFEEKRWDVKFTSFGVSSSESSPVKAPSSRQEPNVQVKDIGEDEMITAFTSDYCPSPLPAKPAESGGNIHSTESVAMFIEESVSSLEDVKPCHESASLLEPVLELDILTNIPSPIETSEEPVDLKPLSQTMPDISSPMTPLTDVPIKGAEGTSIRPIIVETKLAVIDPVCSPVKLKDSARFNERKEAAPAANEAKKPAVYRATESTQAQPARSLEPSARGKKLMRSISRCDSLENSITTVHSDPVISPNLGSLLPLPLSIEANSQDSSVQPNDVAVANIECHKNAELHSSQSSLKLASEPSNSPPSPACESEGADRTERKISLKEKETPIPIVKEEPQPTPSFIASREEWLRMKKEMESALESEKARLENWFKEEIAQIKCQFEKELASERERTECLSKLMERAKNEKEEAARLELSRMQETLANLVEEKTREVQTRLNSELLHTASVLKSPVSLHDANVQTEERKADVPIEKSTSTEPTRSTDVPGLVPKVSHSHRETQVSPVPRQDSWIKCQCDNLQKQVARVEREMQLLKQKNLSFQKSASTRKKSTPIKAQRESWWIDSDESTASSTSCSYAELRPLKHRRSRSMSNLNTEKRSHNSRKSKPSERTRDILSRSQTPRRSPWMEDISPDRSTDTLTSGVSSTLSAAGEWDTVLNSIHKISDDIHEVWSHIGRRQRPLSCLPSHRFTDSFWTSTSTPIYQGNRVPLHWSLSGSTAERTQALKLWLQQNNSHHTQLLCKTDQS